jgi:hypothetical protein
MSKVLCIGRVVKGRLIFEKVLPRKEIKWLV